MALSMIVFNFEVITTCSFMMFASKLLSNIQTYEKLLSYVKDNEVAVKKLQVLSV